MGLYHFLRLKPLPSHIFTVPDPPVAVLPTQKWHLCINLDISHQWDHYYIDVKESERKICRENAHHDEAVVFQPDGITILFAYLLYLLDVVKVYAPRVPDQCAKDPFVLQHRKFGFIQVRQAPDNYKLASRVHGKYPQ